jgi:hypothetical protein
VVQRLASDGGVSPHGILVLETSGETIVGIDAFMNPALVPEYG